MEQNSQSCVVTLRKLTLLKNGIFLQYMQIVWAYYLEILPHEAQKLEEFKDFHEQLTLMEKTATQLPFSHSVDNFEIPSSISLHETSYTMLRLRLQLMAKFNRLLSALEKKESAMEDNPSATRIYHLFFEAILDAYEQVRPDLEDLSATEENDYNNL